MSHPARLNAVIARAVDGSKFDLEFYHKNYLDHVYAVSDDSGNLNEHYRYTAFGEATIYDSAGTIKSSSQIKNSILWNTRRLDQVSNYYLYKYRHYDPALGRWPSRDPIEEGGGVNLYAFVNNDALGKWDILGLAIIIVENIPGIEVPCCKGQEGVFWVTDDAGRKCCEPELTYVELNCEIDGEGGHAWLGSIKWHVGFHPTKNPNYLEGTREWYSNDPLKRQGMIENDEDKTAHAKVRYNACPESVEELKKIMRKHGKDKWVLNNTTGRNCMGWACSMLNKTGFATHCKADTKRLTPHDILKDPNVIPLKDYIFPKDPTK